MCQIKFKINFRRRFPMTNENKMKLKTVFFKTTMQLFLARNNNYLIDTIFDSMNRMYICSVLSNYNF